MSTTTVAEGWTPVDSDDGWLPEPEPEPTGLGAAGWLVAFVLIVGAAITALVMIPSGPDNPAGRRGASNPGGVPPINNAPVGNVFNAADANINGGVPQDNGGGNENSPPPGPPPDPFPPARPAQRSSPDALQVLFVGNSYTAAFGLPNLVRQVAASAPDPVIIDPGMSGGGQSFRDHAMNLKQILEGWEWDFVVLQGQSVEGAIPQARRQFVLAGLTCAEAAMEAGAQVVWYSTWARRKGHEFYSDPMNPIGTTPDEMLSNVNASYGALFDATRSRGARIAWVGNAWAAALATPGAQIDLYEGDGSHPSLRGAYLTALTIAQALTGVPATDFSYAPEGMPAQQVILLKAAAASAGGH